MEQSNIERSEGGRITYFSVPTQLIFWDGEDYVGGIGYGSSIICGCCGGIVPLEDVYADLELMPADKAPILPFEYSWNDLSEEIRAANIYELDFSNWAYTPNA